MTMVTKRTSDTMYHKRVIIYSGLKQGIGKAFKFIFKRGQLSSHILTATTTQVSI